MLGDLKGAFDAPVGSPSPVPPVTYRSFDDVSGQRDAIYSNALRGVRALKPVENEKYRVEIADPDYAQDYNPSLSDEKKALMSRQSMQRAIKGRVRLIDKASGQVVDETETTLAHVPHLTPRGIFVRGGTIWAAKNQQRLRPGVYVLRQQNGDVKAQVNPKPGSGRGFDIQLEPATGVFKLNVGQSGTRLYPLLRSMGVPDDMIKEAWGDDLFKANWRPPGGHDAQEARKIVAKMGRRGDQDTATELLKDKLHEILGRAELDEETTEITLGTKYKNFNIDTMLNATAKMLKRSRNEVPDDVRDSQAFQSFHGPEDFFEERLSRGSDAMRKLLWRATREGNLGNVSPGLLNPAVDSVFQSGLMSSVEDTNPLEIMDARQTITRLGEGGISSNQAVPRSARGVQPSYFGIIDPIRAPEGQNIGVDMRLTDGALKGSDGRLYFKVRSRKGEEVTLSALQASQKPIAFPGEFAKAAKREFYKVPLPGDDGKYVDHVVTMDDISRDPELSASVGMHGLGKPLPPMVRVLDGEDIKWKPAAEVDYEIPHGSSMFSRLTNMVPMTQGAKSQRTLMGARMHSQALPLQTPEAPLVQSANPDGTSIHDSMGAWMGAVKAKAPGRVVAVTPDHIDVVYAGGKKERHELYNNYPLARKTSLHNTPLVREGDAFKPGDVLAKSNFTDDKGQATMGANFRVGYMVGSGHTYEDGFKISESAARRLSSQHAYKHELELDKNIHSTKKADYSSIFQGKYKPEQISGIDDDGVIKEGTIVQPGDPVLLAVRKKTPRPGGVVAPSARSTFADASQTWDHSTPGQVTDVVRTSKGIKVMISSVEPMTEGSKLTARYGNKGVVSQIVPDGEMPVGADGKPLDIIVNSLGVISRANPSVLAETLLGKVAQKTGKPYVLKSFDHEDLGDFALNEAKVNGINELDDVTDPKTGRKIKGIFTGVQHLMRLHHTAESGLAARDTGGYTSDDSPAKGGPEGSKKIALLGVQCLLSAGATNVLKDAKLIRGQRNDDYWRSVKLGMDPVMPAASGAHGHFLSLLKGAGVNVRENQGRLKLAPMTDADTDALAQHSVSTSETFDFETMQPKDGGLFDLAKTGGADGRHFTKIELPQKIPNPVMEEPIIRILGLTKQRFLDVLSGQEKIGDKTGPEAIETALKGINVEREIAMHIQGVKTGSKSSRDVHVRALNYLSGLKSAGVAPADLMISKIPVIPPKFRPVIRAGKMDIIHDANYLYHDLMESGKNYTEAQKTFGDAGEEYGAMYAAAKAVAGLGAPINPKHVEQGVKGLLQNAIGVGDSPKFARFQRKVLGQAVDTVGRGVATPDPELDMDQVSIPKDMAWTVYRPYVIRRLVRSGWSAREAVMAVREQKPAAFRELQNEMKARPVYWDRAPALQRYNYVGAWPVLSRGNNIGVPQVVEPGANLDFDGDKINLHVPSHHDAVRDVIEKMMPSKNLWHPKDFDVHLKPDKDYLAGLYLATSIKKNKTPRTFASKEDAYQAYLRGDLGVADPVVILSSQKPN